MISHLSIAYPVKTATEQQLQHFVLAVKLAVHNTAPDRLIEGMEGAWKNDKDTFKRKVSSIAQVMQRMKTGSANNITITMIWSELEKVRAQQAHDAAQEAVLKYANMVASMEAKAKDITDMPDEAAHRTLRRYNEANNMLQSLYTWWTLQKSLWQSVAEFQMQQDNYEGKYHEAMRKLDETLPLKMTRETMTFRINILIDEGYTTAQDVQATIWRLQYRHLFEDWVLSLWQRRHDDEMQRCYAFMARHDAEMLELISTINVAPQLRAQMIAQIESSKQIYQSHTK